MEEYLIYLFFRLPGALILWIFTGFKYKIGGIIVGKNENKKEAIISVVFWIVLLAAFLIIRDL